MPIDVRSCRKTVLPGGQSAISRAPISFHVSQGFLFAREEKALANRRWPFLRRTKKSPKSRVATFGTKISNYENRINDCSSLTHVLGKTARLLAEVDNLLWANRGARPTLRACVSVNFVDVAFWNSLYRALIDASSACDAVFTNYVSHNNSFCWFKMFLYNM